MNCLGSTTDYYLYTRGWIVDDQSCRRAYMNSDPVTLHIPNQLCAQFRNSRGQLSGSDGGDSRGPLYATLNVGFDVQIGIVSFSSKLYVNTTNQCTNAQIPMVYNKVAAEERFIQWVAPIKLSSSRRH